MLKRFLSLFARLPLPVIHALGGVLGGLLYLGSADFRRRTWQNIQISGIAANTSEIRRIAIKSSLETGKSTLEALAIWFRPQHDILDWVRDSTGWEHVTAAHDHGQGIVFLTPHLGCFEITAIFYAAHAPISVLYSPSRLSWLEPLILQGRTRHGTRLAPTTLTGIKTLLQALRKREAVGILPDQVPAYGDGIWANFFGHPAYSMTLAGRLAIAGNNTVLLAYGERLSWGRGYIVHIEPLGAAPTPQNINNGIERLVRRQPGQYLWSYRRFKPPKSYDGEIPSAEDIARSNT